MIRALLLLLPFVLLCTACEDDDCPVCPEVPGEPAALTGTWEASFLTQDGFTERVDWIFTQTDSTIIAVIQHGVLHNTIMTDTIPGIVHHEGSLSLSGSEDNGFAVYTLDILAVLNESRDYCMGRIVHTETISGHSSSEVQPFYAERK